mmetsp:Transcript_94632/g.272463  ORF Transcript_94632/g.272463 Transcript_94632/m.272463 type:complete len:334 (+) Transcript_94632:102-1103(+)
MAVTSLTFDRVFGGSVVGSPTCSTRASSLRCSPAPSALNFGWCEDVAINDDQDRLLGPHKLRGPPPNDAAIRACLSPGRSPRSSVCPPVAPSQRRACSPPPSTAAPWMPPRRGQKKVIAPHEPGQSFDIDAHRGVIRCFPGDRKSLTDPALRPGSPSLRSRNDNDGLVASVGGTPEWAGVTLGRRRRGSAANDESEGGPVEHERLMYVAGRGDGGCLQSVRQMRHRAQEQPSPPPFAVSDGSGAAEARRSSPPMMSSRSADVLPGQPAASDLSELPQASPGASPTSKRRSLAPSASAVICQPRAAPPPRGQSPRLPAPSARASMGASVSRWRS